jgi:hypothetical protein
VSDNDPRFDPVIRWISSAASDCFHVTGLARAPADDRMERCGGNYVVIAANRWGC